MIEDRYGNKLKKPKNKPTINQSLDSWALLNELVELGYPHNFQREYAPISPSLVDYCFDISALIDKARKIMEEPKG